MKLFFFGALAGAAVACGVGFVMFVRPLRETAFEQRRLELARDENGRLRARLMELEREKKAAADAEQRRAIEQQVSKLRGLKFLEPVRYQIVGRESMPGMLRKRLDEQFSEKEFRDTADGYAAMGLLPAGYDLRKALVDLLSEQVAALYDQHQHVLFLYSDADLANAGQKTILAHELTHVLQDQHFKVATLPLEAKDDDDLAMSSSALVEGDATALMTLFTAQRATAGELMGGVLEALGQDVSQMARAPRFLRESLLFPYLRGQAFCETLMARGGTATLDRAFREPPRSSAEILDPSRYIAPALRPARKFEAELAAPEGMTRIATNVAGQFGIECIYGEWLPDQEARAVDWDADRYWVFRGKSGGVGVIWRTAWRTEAAATTFAKKLEAVFAARFGADPRTAGRRMQAVVRSGNEVTAVDAPDAATRDNLMAKAVAAVSTPLARPAN